MKPILLTSAVFSFARMQLFILAILAGLLVPALFLLSAEAQSAAIGDANADSLRSRLAQLKQHREAWPAQLTLKSPVPMPIVSNGQVVGSIVSSAGATVDLISVNDTTLEIRVVNARATVAPEVTDLWERVAAAASAQKSPPSPAPVSTAASPMTNAPDAIAADTTQPMAAHPMDQSSLDMDPGQIPNPSDAYYDWTVTREPERPYIHDYSQTLVMKLDLSWKLPQEGSKVHLTIAQAMDVIKRLDHLTCGIPKIIYLVGWQHNGHDSKYPDWSVVNPRLKRDEDATAEDSLRWLMTEGFKYHTIVSLHINMLDAYADSPLWDTYVQNNIIAKDKDGNLIKGSVWGSSAGPEAQSYPLSYYQEWKTGYTRKRIDVLLALLPIQRAGTIHIDAFHSFDPNRRDQPISPFLGNTTDDEVATQRRIFRYFRTRGVDVTSEFTNGIRRDAFIGLQPMAWHYQAPAPNLPASLYCGTPMPAEEETANDPIHLNGLKEQFCLNVVPWYYNNNTTAMKGSQKTRDGDDLFMPALWEKQTVIAYSKNGYQNKTWQLPPGWETVEQVQASEVSVDGLGNPLQIPVKDGGITLNMSPGQALEIKGL